MTIKAAPLLSLHLDHLDHLADFQRSGLTDETIAALGIYSARPQDIPKLVGFDPPGVESALVFPYPGEDGFCRVKVFPPYQDKDGHTVKYLQRPKSGVHLYRPPLAEKVLKDPTIPLAWTEGEKKAAKACQEGIPCIGLGGLWNWLEDGKPVPKLDEIAQVEREEIIYADSDVWSRPDLLRAVYALGKELESRGAKVAVAIIPPGANSEKWGLDDYLVALERDGMKAQEALAKLKRIPLKHPAFSQAAAWWKEWKQRKEAVTEPPPDKMKLLERIGQARKLHPAQDFADGALYYGVPVPDPVTGEGFLLLFVTSDRRVLLPSELSPDVKVHRSGFNVCRFSKEGIIAFLGGASMGGQTLLRELEAYFQRFVVFRDPRISLFLAVWTVGTYVYRLYRVFPYMVLRSPRPRCGKTRVLVLLALVAFNASSLVTNPTEAQLFREPSRNGGTLLLDEVEQLRGNPELFAGLLAVLNSGFEKGGVVTRLEKRGDRFEPVDFPTYCPRALAGLSRLPEILEDRSIIVFMTRKLKSERVDRFSRSRLEAEAQWLRDLSYTWALTHAVELAEVYEADDFPGLEDLDDRARDLWEPLLSITLLADAEAREAGETADFTNRLAALAQELCRVRDESDTTTVKLITALVAILGKENQEKKLRPPELLQLLHNQGIEWVKSTNALARLLNPFNLVAVPEKIKIGDKWKSARLYTLDRDRLEDLRLRYSTAEEDEDDEDESSAPPSQNL